MPAPIAAAVEYWTEECPDTTEWITVPIDIDEGVDRLVGYGTGRGLPRLSVSVRIGEYLYRDAERVWVWDGGGVIHVASEMRDDLGPSTFDLISYADGSRSREELTRQALLLLVGSQEGLRSPFIGKSMPNVYARGLGFKKD